MNSVHIILLSHFLDGIHHQLLHLGNRGIQIILSSLVKHPPVIFCCCIGKPLLYRTAVCKITHAHHVSRHPIRIKPGMDLQASLMSCLDKIAERIISRILSLDPGNKFGPWQNIRRIHGICVGMRMYKYCIHPPVHTVIQHFIYRRLKSCLLHRKLFPLQIGDPDAVQFLCFFLYLYSLLQNGS